MRGFKVRRKRTHRGTPQCGGKQHKAEWRETHGASKFIGSRRLLSAWRQITEGADLYWQNVYRFANCLRLALREYPLTGGVCRY